MKKGISFIYFYFKAKAKINTTDNQKQTLAGAVGVFASIVLTIFFFFFENNFFVSTTVRPILLVEKIRVI